MNAAKRLAELEDALEHARYVCETAVVVVEGRSDMAALEDLGIGGIHRQINERGTVDDFVVSLAEGGGPVVLLVDWDRTGGRLARRLHDGLVGQVPVNLDVRRRIASASHCKCFEHIPAELAGLRRKTGLRAG